MTLRDIISRVFFIFVLGFWMVSCSPSQEQELVVYSGRSRPLVDELVNTFRNQTGINVSVKYGNDAELLAVLNEEGEQSPADVYWANTTGAMAAANKQGLLSDLPDSLINKPDAFQTSGSKWIPVTVRFRVLAYNPERVEPEELPTSVMDLPSMEQFQGRVGWTPTYSSFYDFLTTLRLDIGENETLKWLRGMQQLEPKSYGSNPPMVQAIAAGEIDVALTNHYYILQLKYGGAEGEYEEEEEFEEGFGEPDDQAQIETYHFEPGDIGNLALVTGATQLKTSDNSEAAQKFLGFLLSHQAQSYAAETVHEYPVVEDVTLPSYMLETGEAFRISPEYDFEQLQQLEGTLKLLREAGLI